MLEELFGFIWIKARNESADHKKRRMIFIGKGKHVIYVEISSLHVSSLRTINKVSLGL